ncbi:hypothetical protein [Streptomyces hokutonensis]|uniref:hypothetical protein n=1 Tax=Streptomyces hokutonensis TaxID=1306990 RepID=UPI001319CD16|nr:hypothetical protein [Streptomyces hokutonensis]
MGGATAGAAAGRLVQDRGIEQPQLHGSRPGIRRFLPAGVGEFLPQVPVLAQSHAAQQSDRQPDMAAGVGAQGALPSQQPGGGGR